MEKIDLKKAAKSLYAPSAKEVSVVEVPEMQFLMVDGVGDPNASTAFQQAMEALFSVSYTIKFLARDVLGIDYGVLPSEGLWWMADGAEFDVLARERWAWTLMIRQPDCITPELIARGTAQAAAKKDLPALEHLHVERYAEGLSAQILHLGPFSEEGPTVARLHRHIAEAGYTLRGKHHEIYLSDIRRAAPEKWKTIIRQPIE